MRIGLVSPATYNANTGKPNQGETRLLLPLTWSAVTAVLDGGDAAHEYVHFDDIVDRHQERLLDCPVVLFSALTGQIARAREIASWLRTHAKQPQRFILGGIHVTAIVKEALRAYLFAAMAPHVDDPVRGPAIRRVMHDDARVTPLDKVVEAARGIVPDADLYAMQDDPFTFLRARSDQDVFDRRHIPGHWYMAELLALHDEFDVTFAGLIDGRSPVAESVRDRLLFAMKNSTGSRCILSHGFGEVSEAPTPNWGIYFQDGMAEKLFPAVVSSQIAGRRVPLLTYETGRGCQYACEFCSVVNFFGPLSYRDTDRVVHDLCHGIETYGAYEYFFVDDNLNGSPSKFRALVAALQRVKDKHPRFGWAGQLTFEHVAKYEADIVAAKRSGMSTVYLGLESVDAHGDLNKGHNRHDEIVSGLQLLKRIGVVAYCNVIFGLPGDGEDFDERMVRGLSALDVSAIVPFTCSFLPGTALFNRLYREGDAALADIVESGWRYNNSFDVVRGTDHLGIDGFNAVRRRFVERYGSHERLVETATSYYKPLASWSPGEVIARIGDFAQIIAFNLLICDALAEHRHYMACGPYRIDLGRFLRVYRDAARRRERGMSGLARVGLLTLLAAAAPLIEPFFARHPIGSFLDWKGTGKRPREVSAN